MKEHSSPLLRTKLVSNNQWAHQLNCLCLGQSGVYTHTHTHTHTRRKPKLKEYQILPFILKRVSLVAQSVKCLPAMRETRVRSLAWEDPLEKETATHSSILALSISRTEEPGRLQSKSVSNFLRNV